MSPARDTAEAQLERILYILPTAARGGRVRIEDIARALDVDADTILRDLEHATARAYYHPAGSVDSFSITTDGRTVQVHAPREFTRPVRLTQGEAMAVGLGLRALAAEEAPVRRAEILAFAARLEAALVVRADLREPEADYVASAMPWRTGEAREAAESDVEYDAMGLAFDDDAFRGILADAIELHRTCTITYLKPRHAGPAQRRIAPYRLVYARGLWYALASDVGSQALRWFRLDRILDARLEDERAPAPPADLDEQLERGVPYSAADEVEVTVRYSPRVARWIAERTSQQIEQDGSAVVRHRVADPGWIVRHVLQYAGEAVVESPAEARQWLHAAASEARERVRAGA